MILNQGLRHLKQNTFPSPLAFTFLYVSRLAFHLAKVHTILVQPLYIMDKELEAYGLDDLPRAIPCKSTTASSRTYFRLSTDLCLLPLSFH